jgi:hypothetical protein
MPFDVGALNAASALLSNNKPKRGAFVSGVSSGIDDLQGLMYSAGGAVADTVGADGARDWMNDQAARNQQESVDNGRPDLDRIEDVYDSPSKWLPYAAYQVGKQIPNLAGAVAAGMLVPEVAVPAWLARGAAYAPRALGGGGMAGRVAAATAEGGSTFAAKKAALSAGQTMANQVVGGGAFNYAQGVGSLYQESVDAGVPDGPRSLLEGVPYALTETLPEAMMIGRIGHGTGFKGGMLARMGKAGASQSATGATSEILQNEMEMGMHPDGQIGSEEANSRRLNSGVAGGLVEGLLGSFGGVRGHRAPRDMLNGQDVIPAMQEVGAPSTEVTTELSPEQQQAAQLAAQQKAAADAQKAQDAAAKQAVRDAYNSKVEAATGWALTQDEIASGKALPLPATVVNAVHQLVSLGDQVDPAKIGEFQGRIGSAALSRDKGGLNSAASDIVKHVAELRRNADRAAKEKQKAADTAKAALDKVEEEKRNLVGGQQEQADTNLKQAQADAAKAITDLQARVAAEGGINDDTEWDALLESIGAQGSGQTATTNAGTATTSEAPANTAAASAAPGATTQNAVGTQPAVVPSTNAVKDGFRLHKIGTKEVVTATRNGKSLTVPALHYHRLRALMGLDENGNASGKRKTLQEVADAEDATTPLTKIQEAKVAKMTPEQRAMWDEDRRKNSRSRIYRSAKQFFPGEEGTAALDALLAVDASTLNRANNNQADMLQTGMFRSEDSIEGSESNVAEDGTKALSDEDTGFEQETGDITGLFEGADEGSGATGYRVSANFADAAKGDHMDPSNDLYKGVASASESANPGKLDSGQARAKADSMNRRAEAREERQVATAAEEAKRAAEAEAQIAKNQAIVEQHYAGVWASNLEDSEAKTLAWSKLHDSVKAEFTELLDNADDGTMSRREYNERYDNILDRARADGAANNANNASVATGEVSDPIARASSSSSSRTTPPSEGGSTVSSGSGAPVQTGSTDQQTAAKPAAPVVTTKKVRRAPAPGAVAPKTTKPLVEESELPKADTPIEVVLTANGKPWHIPDAHKQIERFMDEINRLEAFAKCVRRTA